MVVQARSNNSNTPFIRSSHGSNATSGAIIKQDAGRAAVLAFATVLGRSQVVATSITADVGNTGDGTFTAFALAQGGVPIAGAWNLECVAAVADGGVFKLEDPNSVVRASALIMNAGAGLATIFTVAGMVFTITDGAANFIVGDKAAIVITADGDYVPLAIDGVGGAESVAGILLSPDIAAADIVAGDVANNLVLLGGNLTVTSGDVVLDDGVSTLATVLPSGKTVNEELALIGIFTEDTVDISSFENA